MNMGNPVRKIVTYYTVFDKKVICHRCDYLRIFALSELRNDVKFTLIVI